MHTPLLDSVRAPFDIRRFTSSELKKLCSELRSVIIETVSKNGGHLSSNLGAVELTVALHCAFDSPSDKLLFDVGHQCYAHKLLTGRREQFHTLRTYGGLSGFPKPNESEHDAFVTGHSSTALSGGTGIAAGMRLQGNPGYTVVVVGDGALTGGLSYEGLNNAVGNGKLIVVLNDNDNSISKNVGSVAHYLSKTTSNPRYFKIKDATRRTVQALPLIGDPMYRAVSTGKRMVKDAITHSNFFENFGFEYFGPLDGHDIKAMVDVFLRAREIDCPAFIHVKTQKGRGAAYAQRAPGLYHSVSRFDASTGQIPKPDTTFSSVFGKTICELAAHDERIVGITAAMQDGVGLKEFAQTYPDRFFDVGIAEQHAVTFAAGLAKAGMRPCVAVYSTFLQRAYDQIVHDVALSKLPVVFAVDRAGIVGEDGETHHGLLDAAFLSHIPNMTVYAPATYVQMQGALKDAFVQDGPVAVRYPRGNEAVLLHGMPVGDVIRCGEPTSDVILMTYGRTAANCIEAMHALNDSGQRVAVCVMQKICPIDAKSLCDVVPPHARLLFVEEGVEAGGIGQQTILKLIREGYCGEWDILAVDDKFLPHGSTQELMSLCGMSTQGIVERVMRLLERSVRSYSHG